MSDSGKIRVLIVEDDALACKMIRHILEKSGYEVAGCASAGLQALEMAPALRPDVILLDIVLPDMDGFEVARRLLDIHPVPAVVLSRYEEQELVERAGAVGVGSYLIKPVNAQELKRAIQITMARFADMQALRRLNAALQNEINERKQAQEALQTSRANFRNMIEKSSDGIIIVDKNGIARFVNSTAEDLFGPKAKSLIGELFGLPIVLGRSTEVDIVRGRGETGVGEMGVAETEWEREGAYLVSIRDITKRKQYEDFLHNLSYLDELTGLYNRRGFFSLCDNQLRLARRETSCITVFFFDLDGLKHINDIYGHKSGDQALIAAAAILRETFRTTDIIGRLGGDEFAVLAMKAGADSIAILNKRMQERMRDFNRQGKLAFDLSFSMGTASHTPENPLTLEQLVAKADACQYEEKKAKKQGEAQPVVSRQGASS